MSGAPADYEELFERYYGLIRKWVRRANIVEQDVDDVALDLIAKFIEKRGLENYDPDRVWASGRRAKFQTMLSAFVNTYVMNYRDRQMYQYEREVLKEDPTEDRFYEVGYGAGLEYQGWVEEVAAYLKTLPVNSGRDIAAVFLQIVEELETCDVVRQGSVVAKALGDGSRYTTTRSMRDLRAALVAGEFV